MHKLLLALLLALASAVPAVAQVTGNECWTANSGTTAGPVPLCTNLVRNGQAINVFSGAGAVATVAVRENALLMWTGTAPTTWTITLPNPAFDGESITVSTDTTLTSLVTVQAATAPQNQTMAAAFSAQTVTAATSAEWRFQLSTLKWYKVR